MLDLAFGASGFNIESVVEGENRHGGLSGQSGPGRGRKKEVSRAVG